MPRKFHQGWAGNRAPIRGSHSRTVTVTFNYDKRGFKTLVARNRDEAFESAVARWGEDWIGEPCVSSAESIFNDLVGWTKRNHGQDFKTELTTKTRSDRFRRTNKRYRGSHWVP